ncbi:MAG: hypothetical protein HY033_05890 [Ignavibacteriae bacterium]|nr:hypothetical protein [Ignavibacteria bacterium]MBI3364422.1 hypothetical protein [Ignavibacteriota bacterium]
MLEKEFKYYREHQTELVQEYNNKYVVIKDEKVLGAYNSELEAYTETKKNHAVGTFLIQHVTPGSAGYTQTFHSRVDIRRE